jgi:uncharacterized protein YjbJ (UPF0337 family)
VRFGFERFERYRVATGEHAGCYPRLPKEVTVMNWDQIEGQWKQLSSQVKTQWAKLTDDDLKGVSAKKDELVGKIQERYGVMREEAQRQVDEWMQKLPSHHQPS